jgi:hypothetical protein
VANGMLCTQPVEPRPSLDAYEGDGAWLKKVGKVAARLDSLLRLSVVARSHKPGVSPPSLQVSGSPRGGSDSIRARGRYRVVSSGPSVIRYPVAPLPG